MNEQATRPPRPVVRCPHGVDGAPLGNRRIRSAVAVRALPMAGPRHSLRLARYHRERDQFAGLRRTPVQPARAE